MLERIGTKGFFQMRMTFLTVLFISFIFGWYWDLTTVHWHWLSLNQCRNYRELKSGHSIKLDWFKSWFLHQLEWLCGCKSLSSTDWPMSCILDAGFSWKPPIPPIPNQWDLCSSSCEDLRR
jgi:hypothetical protein